MALTGDSSGLIGKSDEVDFEVAALAAEVGADKSVIEPSMRFVSEWLQLEESDIPSDSSSGTPRSGKMTPHGTAHSSKLRNLSYDKGKLSELAAQVALWGTTIIAQPHPVVVVAVLLLSIRRVTDAMTVNLSEREASVFWGIIQASGRGYIANRVAIIGRTNEWRVQLGRSTLTQDEIADALRSLQALRCIAPVPGSSEEWRVIEQFAVTG